MLWVIPFRKRNEDVLTMMKSSAPRGRETKANISYVVPFVGRLFSSGEGCKAEGWLFQKAHLALHNEYTVCAPNINVLLCNMATPQNI